jgi:hypothetical protein
VTGLPLANTQAAIADGFLPAGFNTVSGAVYGVLVAAGTSPGDPANWVSNLAVLDLAMETLSLDQILLIAERGNPSAYVIQFFHDTAQRVETWLYDGGGLGQVFQFINGRPVARDDDHERASASVVAPAVFWDPGRFSPTTSPAEIRALLGEPDRVVTSPAGAQTWFFEDSHMSVTVHNGVVRQVEAH